MQQQKFIREQHKKVVRNMAVYRYSKQKLNVSAKKNFGRQKRAVNNIHVIVLVCHLDGLNWLRAVA